MDSNLLEVTPVDVEPKVIVQNALDIFAAELSANDVQMEFHVEQSYKDLEVEWVRLDPSHLMQVLINLTTNTLKFTKTEEHRKIIVSIGASLHAPARDYRGASYLPVTGKLRDLTTRPDWGTGEPLFLHVCVRDTGRGISESEMKMLFQRFSQINPKTHIDYGGSGLGLYIARELSEIQGGGNSVTFRVRQGQRLRFLTSKSGEATQQIFWPLRLDL